MLKGFDDDGFVFFTNHDSAKGRDLAAHPRACLLFFWVELERQVRFWQGRASRLHDRLLYVRQADGSWARSRLSP